ncbi:MAG: CDP-diacylglycerol--glycerol-3-phosphate 3-phosphatidyltransferase [Brevundimonas sp.]|uniref:CDP-diacylglycerol--glycerol-3-phosphate 3-phosphatidyltransferase n=1 Tax=Brevundimonas sp. TaxID=1871086 RepID=UPI0025C13BD3|nr:CDP-diacylglycerol--glycerol-3-phosphate 3-phosphatidyltransferase [Brevundimonas sp.]MBX3477050.1 CDP-diacylglycerol--glycerol-3-phosphate 3-phosphatidyltransferase [Brevundimonas sp.]
MTPNPHANPLPNILTGLRLVAGVVMFVMMAGAAPGALDTWLSPETQARFGIWAFWIFVVAASTDWLDGWLARRWNAATRWGAILDPIADKVLITGAILGVLASGSLPGIALPCGLILFREFAVSALRETVAGSVKLPVTLMAKWKTTVQMIALAALQLTLLWGAFGLLEADGSPLAWQGPFESFAVFLIWFAAVITVWTGIQYFREARRQMG